jgi:hypothetical protein
MVAIRWTNDDVDEAPTWQALLDLVRETQWHVYETELEFREAMAHRCEVWSGTAIDPGGTPEELFRELERARLIEIVADVSDA